MAIDPASTTFIEALKRHSFARLWAGSKMHTTKTRSGSRTQTTMENWITEHAMPIMGAPWGAKRDRPIWRACLMNTGCLRNATCDQSMKGPLEEDSWRYLSGRVVKVHIGCSYGPTMMFRWVVVVNLQWCSDGCSCMPTMMFRRL